MRSFSLSGLTGSPQPFPQQTAIALSGLLVGLFLGSLLLLAAGRFPVPFGQPALNGTVYEDPLPLPDFTLQATAGREVSLSDFRGRWVLLYFGYTYCPDVCPVTSSLLAQAVSALQPGQHQQVQVLLVTVDPERDTAGRLNRYLHSFHPDFLGLTGNEQDIAGAASSLGIYYEKQPSKQDGHYTVDHTASMMLLDPEGRLKLVYPFGTPAASITADLQQLLDG